MLKFLIRCYNAARIRIIWFICHLFPIDSQKVVICSYYGRGYGDNPKYIADQLLKEEKKVRIIWLVKDLGEAETLPDGIEACMIDTIKSVYHLMTAKVWIDNCRKFFIMFKRKKQYYIQTWHGFALKRIEKDVENKLAKDYVKSAKRDSKNIDYVISCSGFMSQIYRQSFWYDGEIKEFGSPRNDILICGNRSIDVKVRDYFKIEDDKKIVLYAPTFRANENLDVYNLDYTRVLKACEKRFGGSFIFITRFHPNIAEHSHILSADPLMKNGTYYPDMQELMAVSDVIITDYSSVMFDFALTGKPCFQFAVDIEDYRKDRNFYFALDQLPFDVSINNNALEKSILNFDEVKYRKELELFYDQVGMIRDGYAGKRCSSLIVELMNRRK